MKKVLIIDDSAIFVRVCKKILEGMGLKVFFAGTGAEGSFPLTGQPSQKADRWQDALLNPAKRHMEASLFRRKRS